MNTLARILFIMILWVIIPGFASSCSDDRERGILDPGESKQDTLRIEFASAVFFQADSGQVKKMREHFEGEAVDNWGHECFYQVRNARQAIEKNWPGIKIINASGVRFIEFVKNNGTRSLVDLERRQEMCGVFLFERGREPVAADMMNIETELGFYFSP